VVLFCVNTCGADKTPARSHEQTGVYRKSRKKKQTVKVLDVYKPIFIFIGGRFKRQRIGKLHCHASEIRAEFIDAADLTVTDEVSHIVGVLLAKLGNAEPRGDVLTIGRTLVRIAGKRRPATGDIHPKYSCPKYPFFQQITFSSSCFGRLQGPLNDESDNKGLAEAGML
jgi:hypothetical protein